MPSILLIVCPASTVWRVLKTRWPVSAALSPISTVSLSRISPTKMIFGACLSAARRPLANVSKSVPISLWLNVAFLCGCWNSTGSSRVTTWTDLLSFISLRSAAREVVFPVPVAPVTSIVPFFSSAILWNASGSFSSSHVGILVSSFLNTIE